MAVQSAATQAAKLAEMQLVWRSSSGQECVKALQDAKAWLRETNGLCNAYIETAIKLHSATTKHAAAVASGVTGQG